MSRDTSPRWWDGCLRAVASTSSYRHLESGKPATMLHLECGHAQDAPQNSSKTWREVGAICLECARLKSAEAVPQNHRTHEWCAEVGPQGEICVRPKGHPGQCILAKVGGNKQ